MRRTQGRRLLGGYPWMSHLFVTLLKEAKVISDFNYFREEADKITESLSGRVKKHALAQ